MIIDEELLLPGKYKIVKVIAQIPQWESKGEVWFCRWAVRVYNITKKYEKKLGISQGN